MNLAPQNLQQVALCYTLVIIFPANDLCIYAFMYFIMIYVFMFLQNLESTFIEILSPKKTNVIVGCFITIHIWT